MQFKICSALIIVTLLSLTSPALAAKQYVSDQLVLTLRETANPDSAVLGHLKTDAAVEVLAEEGEFARVRSELGTGYVRRQFLTTTPPKQFTIDRLEQQVATLSQQLESYTAGGEGQQQELDRLRRENRQLESSLAQAQEQLAELQGKHERLLANSEDLLEIIGQRDQLLETTTRLEAETLALREENERLLATGIIKWFLAGAGTLCFGWLLGKISRKKRRGF